MKKSLLFAAVIALAVFGYRIFASNTTATRAQLGSAESSGTTPEPVVTTPTPTQTEKKVSTTATYRTPAGMDQVSFTLTVDGNGVITSAEAGVLAKNRVSVERQTNFAAGFSAAVKGKKLSDLTSIDRVGGSSLTTGAFNSSLAALKAQI